jgi:hypothetical protein
MSRHFIKIIIKFINIIIKHNYSAEIFLKTAVYTTTVNTKVIQNNIIIFQKKKKKRAIFNYTSDYDNITMCTDNSMAFFEEIRGDNCSIAHMIDVSSVKKRSAVICDLFLYNIPNN